MEITNPKPFCLVLMPFSKAFDNIYKYGIKKPCEEVGAYCERVDEQVYQEKILERIYNQIAKADLIVADMSKKNANVFYEVGYAHALGKSTILLTQSHDDIPFDLLHFPHIIYDTNKIEFLEQEVKKRVEFNMKNPKTKIEDKLAIDIFSGDKNLSAEDVIVEIEGVYSSIGIASLIKITVFNNSIETYSSNQFKISIIGSPNLGCAFALNEIEELKSVNMYGGDINSMVNQLKLRITTLPNMHKLTNLPPIDLYPFDYYTYLINLGYNSLDTPEKITIRLYTKYGNRDYFLTLKKV